MRNCTVPKPQIMHTPSARTSMCGAYYLHESFRTLQAEVYRHFSFLGCKVTPFYYVFFNITLFQSLKCCNLTILFTFLALAMCEIIQFQNKGMRIESSSRAFAMCEIVQFQNLKLGTYRPHGLLCAELITFTRVSVLCKQRFTATSRS